MSNEYSTEFSGKKLSLKANYVAAQADGAILATYGDTVVLVTVVSLKDKREGLDFLPLTVDYQEPTSAAGKIPGGFFKREGRPNEREILTSRMIDRSIRPLFPKGYHHETQVVATVFSVDTEHDPDVTALLATSVALEMSDIPFKGPIAAARVGRIDGNFVCNASIDEMAQSDINLFLAGRMVPHEQGEGYDMNLIMLEGGAEEVDDSVIVDAITFGLNAMRPVIDLQIKLKKEIGKAKREVAAEPVDEALSAKVTEKAEADLQAAYRMPRKQDRYSRLSEIRKSVMTELSGEDGKLKPVLAGII
jgi:polyribonucleotide nucleotidyltransferase